MRLKTCKQVVLGCLCGFLAPAFLCRGGEIHTHKAPLYWSVYEYAREMELAGIPYHEMDLSSAQWDAVIAVNLKSAFNFINAVLPIMLRQRSGSIINMASVVGVHGNAGQANYAASKAGLIALAKSIAQEVGSRGIRANAIAPGFIETAMTAALPDEVRAEWAKKIPLRRGGKVEDIADTAVFLASDMSSYITGQVIQVDGGMNM